MIRMLRLSRILSPYVSTITYVLAGAPSCTLFRHIRFPSSVTSCRKTHSTETPMRSFESFLRVGDNRLSARLKVDWIISIKSVINSTSIGGEVASRNQEFALSSGQLQTLLLAGQAMTQEQDPERICQWVCNSATSLFQAPLATVVLTPTNQGATGVVYGKLKDSPLPDHVVDEIDIQGYKMPAIAVPAIMSPNTDRLTGCHKKLTRFQIEWRMR